MPGAVVVRERACCIGVHVWLDGLVEDDGEPTVGPYAQFPRTAAATLDSAVVRRRIRRPIEPGGDREAQGRRSEEHTSELQSHHELVCRLLLEKKNRRPRHPAVMP